MLYEVITYPDKNQCNYRIIRVNFLLFLTFTHAMSEQKPGQLVVFNTLDSGQFTSNDATLSLIENEAIRGIAVKSRDGNQASLVIKPLKCTPWDLTDVYTLKASVTNLASHSTQIAMYVGLDPDPLMRWYCSDYVDLKPGETKTITVQLTWLPWVHRPSFQYTGMRGTPGRITSYNVCYTKLLRFTEAAFYNALGQVVWSAKVTANTLNVEQLPEGVYFVALTTGHKVVMSKVAIQRS